jgi:hypothetical protein
MRGASDTKTNYGLSARGAKAVLFLFHQLQHPWRTTSKSGFNMHICSSNFVLY